MESNKPTPHIQSGAQWDHPVSATRQQPPNHAGYQQLVGWIPAAPAAAAVCGSGTRAPEATVGVGAPGETRAGDPNGPGRGQQPFVELSLSSPLPYSVGGAEATLRRPRHASST